MVSERTPLTGENSKQEFDSNIPLLYRRRTRQFQCCIGALLFALFVTILVILISSLNLKVDDDIEASIQAGKDALDDRDETEGNMTVLQTSSASFRHQKSTATYPKADEIGRFGFATYYATKRFAKNQKYNESAPMQQICNLSSLKEVGWCLQTFKSKCKRLRYRSIDGSCNNLLHPNEWGVAFTQFRRLLPPVYADGIGEPRGGLESNDLPSASTVSNLVHRPAYKNDPNFTVMLAVWGQFMDHDVTATALSRGKYGEAIACCQAEIVHPECFPVRETRKDGSKRCVDFVRSAPAASCCFGPRNQLNQVSSYLDGSVVYGSDKNLADKLRTFSKGSLKMLTTSKGRHLLPTSTDTEDGCNRNEMIQKNKYCFLSGDGRANENIFLTTMHLIWARQHNRISEELSNLNSNWDDEKLYQESRHIVAAQIQLITYAEFLPSVIGYDNIAKYGLLIENNSYFDGYNSNLDVAIANSFAAAAFRFAHTLIPGLYRKFKNNSTTFEYIKLHQMLFDPFRLYDDEVDEIIFEAMQNPIQASDPYFVDDLKQHLFEDSNSPQPCGLDLVALNIQRGRDHGIPNYTAWRKFCNLSVPEEFDEMVEYIDTQSLIMISKLYKTVNDIDLYTGALAEKPLKDSLIGPTANCIISEQFVRLKYADRFWFETSEEPQAFTPKQLNEIRKTTLAGIICDNGDNIKNVPKWVMKGLNSNENYIINCTEIITPDLSLWRD